MRRILLSTLSILSVLVSMAQAPQAFNYQAIGRRANGSIIANQDINVRFSIIEGTALGTTIYQETHTTKTSTAGLFMLSIGQGTVTTGTFASIPWGNGNKYLKVEIGLGGAVYLVQGTTQLLSVPYALYAENAKFLAGNNTVVVNGNTIMGNYQAANNTVVITGNTIAGNYAPAADSTIRIAGNVIGGNYKAANNTVLVNGNTIAGNYQAGTGVSIAGNVISATGGSNSWITDASGIHNNSGNVGVGAASSSTTKLDILQDPTGGLSAGLQVRSVDVWHTAVSFLNTSAGANNRYSFSLGGSGNSNGIGPNNLGIMNHNTAKWVMSFNGTTDYVGIGMNTGNFAPPAKSRLHVFNGDVNIDQIGSGIIMKSPDGQCWRITVNNTGALVSTAIACP